MNAAPPFLEKVMTRLSRRRDRSNAIVERSKRKIETKTRRIYTPDQLIPTGSTLLNLSCSNTPWGGYGRGKISNIIGDSHAGKTILGLTCFAECCYDESFDEYDLVYDEPEHALEFDMDYMFGPRLQKRMIHIHSAKVEDFYGNVLKRIKRGKPFIYMLDSLDALAPPEDEEREKAFLKAVESGGQIKGTFGAGKPKLIAEMLRNITKDIKGSGSHLIIVSQTRDAIGQTFGDKKTRSGGRALKFYCTHEIWLAVKESIKHSSTKLDMGVHTLAKTKKNRLTGTKRVIEYPIYNDLGIDDVQSCIDYLLEHHWSKKKASIDASEFDFAGTESKLIRLIEDKGWERKLRKIVGKVWNEREDSTRLTDRKRRYS